MLSTSVVTRIISIMGLLVPEDFDIPLYSTVKMKIIRLVDCLKKRKPDPFSDKGREFLQEPFFKVQVVPDEITLLKKVMENLKNENASLKNDNAGLKNELAEKNKKVIDLESKVVMNVLETKSLKEKIEMEVSKHTSENSSLKRKLSDLESEILQKTLTTKSTRVQ